MAHKSVQELVTINFGMNKWEAIKKKAGVTVEAFISNESYPDALTCGLIGAATELLGMSADEILFPFGEFWVLNTARQGYGDLLSYVGRNMPEFLDYLPMFHTRVALIFPNLKPQAQVTLDSA
ncbi:MAG: hypothetical protein EXS12_08190 [Phycisphaerales bacterium]|nr:hypothetical protein [Phycisphaerales bacterium]